MLKRIITALLAVVMVASMSVVAFAEHRTPAEDCAIARIRKAYILAMVLRA